MKQQKHKNKQPINSEGKPTQKMTKKDRMELKKKQRVEKLREVKSNIKGQLTAAQSSTKSMGKFDRKAHKEERQHKPKRRKDHSNFSNIQEEVNRNMEILGLVRQAQGSKKV